MPGWVRRRVIPRLNPILFGAAFTALGALFPSSGLLIFPQFWSVAYIATGAVCFAVAVWWHYRWLRYLSALLVVGILAARGAAWLFLDGSWIGAIVYAGWAYAMHLLWPHILPPHITVHSLAAALDSIDPYPDQRHDISYTTGEIRIHQAGT